MMGTFAEVIACVMVALLGRREYAGRAAKPQALAADADAGTDAADTVTANTAADADAGDAAIPDDAQGGADAA